MASLGGLLGYLCMLGLLNNSGFKQNSNVLAQRKHRDPISDLTLPPFRPGSLRHLGRL